MHSLVINGKIEMRLLKKFTLAESKVSVLIDAGETLKKLLDQVEAEDLDKATNTQRFESKLVEIMKRYKI